jgi:predicted GNAT family N-acyltransferase
MRVELLDWERARDAASRIRHRVFVKEQRVPLTMELDESDPQSLHALAYAPDGAAVATGRLLPDGSIGRMAVLEAWRRRGFGSAILERLVAAAHARGDREVTLSAQVHALEFYRRHRFVPEGETYLEAGIAHQRMRRRL